MKAIFDSILQLIFPPKCIFCNKLLPITERTHICGVCFSELPFLSGDYLRIREFFPHQRNDLEVICLCSYEGRVREAVKRFKFYNKSGYYRTLGQLLGRKIKKMTKCRDFDIIMDVPLYKTREKDRGYNQSNLLAHALSRELHIPHYTTVLSRVKATHSQSLLNKSERMINIQDAFTVIHAEKIRGKSILLVDDVVTTGATLGECRRVLLEAGAREVVCSVIASGRKG